MAYTYRHPHYAVSTDIVVFTVRESRLQVLLVRRGTAPFKGSWALPGGFLRPNEDLDGCARRELEEETGLSGFYLEQLYSFGAVDRDPRERVLTVAYFALVRSDELELRAGSDADGVSWTRMDRLPDLAFDHAEIVKTAHERVAAKLEYSTLALQLLPERFTMRELQSVYETVLGQKLDRRNFYKKILAMNELADTGETRIEGAHRPAAIYRLKRPARVRLTR